MSGDEVRARGGFGEDSVRSSLSPGALRKVAELEAMQAHQDAKEAARRELDREEWHRRNTQLAIEQAIENGIEVSPRALRGEQLGHTPRELVEMAWAAQDHADRVEAARQERQYIEWQQENFTAPVSELQAEARTEVEAKEAMQARVAEIRRKKRETWKTIQAARRFAAWDRGAR